MATRSKPSDGGVHSSTADSTQVTSTPRRSANRSALARPTGEKSTPVTSQPCSASQIELRPSPQARSTARPACKPDGLGDQELVGRARPHQLVAAVALVPLPAVHGHPSASAPVPSAVRWPDSVDRAHRPNQRRPSSPCGGGPGTGPSGDVAQHLLHVHAAPLPGRAAALLARHCCTHRLFLSRSERRSAQRCSLRMIFAIFRLMARKPFELDEQARAGPKGLGRRERRTGDVVCGVVHRPLLSYSGIRCQPGRALAL